LPTHAWLRDLEPVGVESVEVEDHDAIVTDGYDIAVRR
jgi:hypothetical protein